MCVEWARVVPPTEAKKIIQQIEDVLS